MSSSRGTTVGHDESSAQAPTDVSRRNFLRGAAGVSAIFLTGTNDLYFAPRATAVTNDAGLVAYRHAMHVHSSFSEGPASLESQIREALASGVDVLHPSDHDWRMSAYQAPDVFHFATSPETVMGRPYSWQPTSSGSLSARDGGIVQSPTSPYDAAATKGSLKVEAASSGLAQARHWFALNGSRANKCHQTNIAGMSLSVDVLADSIGVNGWAEIHVTVSYRPPISTAAGTRPGGTYKITYQLGTQTHSRVAKGIKGFVTIPLQAAAWTSVVIDPVADVAGLWPDLVAGDNALVSLGLGVATRKQFSTRAFFGNLRFRRSQVEGDTPLVTQSQFIEEYRQRYPQLQMHQAVEVSGAREHSNGFFTPRLTNYNELRPSDCYRYTADLMHAAGGLASLNHPFGASKVTEPFADRRRRLAANLLSRRLGGVDIIETGFRQKDGATLEGHLDLTATMWRNGYWVTANGVSDNHVGTQGSWLKESNRFFTGLWQASATRDGAYEALRQGSAFVAELAGFSGTLDIKVDTVGMGRISVRSDLPTRDLFVTTTGMPPDAAIEVWQGPVDYSGALDPNTAVVALVTAGGIVGGMARVSIDASTSCFVYAVIVGSSGRRIAFSNPIFLLREPPPAGHEVPNWRRSLDSLD